MSRSNRAKTRHRGTVCRLGASPQGGIFQRSLASGFTRSLLRTGEWYRMKPLPSALSSLVLVFLCVPAATSAAESKVEESAAADTGAAQGLRLSPAIAWSRGQQRIDLSASLRFRTEGWDAHNDDTDFFQAFRTRLGVRYTWRKLGSVFAELQVTRIHSLDG